MEIKVEPGSYIVAVSGGVDSMVLLHLLHHKIQLSGVRPRKGAWKVVVAHFDHGMREDSVVDRRLVQKTTRHYGLSFVYSRVELGAGASEDVARKARYEFLHKVRESTGAQAIITAHHQDDVIETAMLNLLRGTGRRGMTSLKSTDVIKRPLLHLRKRDLVAYAQANNLQWREDSTNTDPRYLRNHLRHNVLPKISDADKQKFLQIIQELHRLNAEIDEGLKQLYESESVQGLSFHKTDINTEHKGNYKSNVKGLSLHIERGRFVMLPHAVALEVMLLWLREHKVQNVTRPMLEKLVTAAKTLKSGKQVDIDGNTIMKIKGNYLLLVRKG